MALTAVIRRPLTGLSPRNLVLVKYEVVDKVTQSLGQYLRTKERLASFPSLNGIYEKDFDDPAAGFVKYILDKEILLT